LFHTAKTMLRYVAPVVATCFCLLTVAQFTRPLVAITGRASSGASTPYRELSSHTFEEVGGSTVDLALPAVVQRGDAGSSSAPQPPVLQVRGSVYALIWAERPGPIHLRILPSSCDDGH
jgi:hypothetical protein